MTAKEYLKQYEYAVNRAARCREEYETESMLIDAVRSLSDNDGMPRGSGVRKPTEEKAVKLADKRQRLIKAERDAIQIRNELFDFINSIDGDEGKVLYLRYIQLNLWRDIAMKMNFTERAVFQIHARALHIVEEKRSL